MVHHILHLNPAQISLFLFGYNFSFSSASRAYFSSGGVQQSFQLNHTHFEIGQYVSLAHNSELIQSNHLWYPQTQVTCGDLTKCLFSVCLQNQMEAYSVCSWCHIILSDTVEPESKMTTGTEGNTMEITWLKETRCFPGGVSCIIL